LTLVRGVDRDAHRAELHRAIEGHDRLGRVLDERGDTIAGRDTPLAHGVREPVRGAEHPARAPLFAVDVEQLTVRIRRESPGDQFRHRERVTVSPRLRRGHPALRTRRKNARTSSTNVAGCSKAAKWPPLSTSW